MDYKLDVELSAELEPYRSAIVATIKPFIKIELTDNNHPTWWQSKFGGLPYMPKDFAYPKSEAGEYLYLLAQINFAEVPQIEGLPNRGILQFYLAADEDFYGCNFDFPTNQDRFQVIYFPEVDSNIDNLVTDFNFLTPINEFTLPIEGCFAINFSINNAPISPSDYRFNLFYIYNSNEEVDRKFEEYWDKFNSAGHKLLGYPCFTQEDPRNALSDREQYILLSQIDSDSNNNGCNIAWGDNGVCNFFIKQSNLDKLDFADVIYNWDCC